MQHAEFAEVKGLVTAISLDNLHWPSNNILGQWVILSLTLDGFDVRNPSLGFTIVHVAAQHCLISVLMAILKIERIDVDVDPRDSNGQTPLLRATANGHEAVVKLLVKRDDVEADSKDMDGRSGCRGRQSRGTWWW